MDFISSAILSGLIYEMMKNGATITANNLKNKLARWVVDENTAKLLAEEIAQMDLNEDLSKATIHKKLNSSSEAQALMKNIKLRTETIINQHHTGSGDNVGRDKIIK